MTPSVFALDWLIKEIYSRVEALRVKARAAKNASVKKNPEYYRMKSNQWHKENRERKKATADWYSRNLQVSMEKHGADRCRVPVGKSDRNEIRAFIKDAIEKKTVVCHYCGVETSDWEVDHIKPLSKGGEHKVSNICIACTICNQRKHTADGSVWKP